MVPRNLFIFEFIAGGGFNQEEIPSSLFCEGFGMLRCIIEDFKALDMNISTLLDKRIESLSSSIMADKIELIEEDDDYIHKFSELVKKSDCVFIIAPEFSEILYKLTKIVEDNKKNILSINIKGVELGSHKLETFKFFKDSNVNTPETFSIPLKNGKIDKDFISTKIKELNSPIVIKPEDGVGADSIFFIENEENLNQLFSTIETSIDIETDYILQGYIEGNDLSVSLIGTQKAPLILSVNSQNIDITENDKGSEYLGGSVPAVGFECIKDDLNKILTSLDLSKYQGYFGIDFIKRNDGSIFLIEINPRLTTSYLGIRNALNLNPAEIIWKSLKNTLDTDDIEYSHHSLFRRLDLVCSDNDSKELITKVMKNIPELITPPISLGDSNEYSCFIATRTKSLEESESRLQQILLELEEIGFSQIK